MKYRYEKIGYIRPHTITFLYNGETDICDLICESYYYLNGEVENWILENVAPHDWEFSKYGGVIAFTQEEDAMAFILRWA